MGVAGADEMIIGDSYKFAIEMQKIEEWNYSGDNTKEGVISKEDIIRIIKYIDQLLEKR